MTEAKRVVFMTRVLTHYRVPFHNAVRSQLLEAGVQYDLLYSRGRADEEKKGDLVDLPWAEEVPVRYFGPGERLCWQSTLSKLEGAYLVIIGHENNLLANYPIIVRSWFGGSKVAFFGHGRGFQARSKNSMAERFKRFWAGKVHWWFTYTESGRVAVEHSGFPADRITIFNNSVDTSAIVKSLAGLSSDEINELRMRLVGGSENVGVYVGGIYANKRIPFLIEAARQIRERLSDFHLVVIGDGADANLVVAAAEKYDWIHAVGPKFGRDKSLHVSLAKVFLMPGLVGLAVLDSFAYGTPMVTTDLPYHSPEIDYLEDGVNGIVVRDSESAEDYADAVIRVLDDDIVRLTLQEGAATALKTYTIENMARRFAEGVRKAFE